MDSSFSLQKIASEVQQHKLKKWHPYLELFKVTKLITERVKQVFLLHGNGNGVAPKHGVVYHVCRQFQHIYQSENKLMPISTLFFPTDNERQNYDYYSLKASQV